MVSIKLIPQREQFPNKGARTPNKALLPKWPSTAEGSRLCPETRGENRKEGGWDPGVAILGDSPIPSYPIPSQSHPLSPCGDGRALQAAHGVGSIPPEEPEDRSHTGSQLGGSPHTAQEPNTALSGSLSLLNIPGDELCLR